MYVGGVAVANMTFSPGTGKSDFFAPGNILSSSYTDLGSFSGNFFSEDGDAGIQRRWFINQNYGGCPNDVGWIVVNNGGNACNWETSRHTAASRAFLYATNNVRQNYNDNTIGQATVFAITVEAVPEPSTVLLVGSAFAALGVLRRRRA